MISHLGIPPDFQCEPGQWYAVDYAPTGETAVKRAVAQYALEDGQKYMMHFSDEDFATEVPVELIFELENPDEVYRVPPQVSPRAGAFPAAMKGMSG